MVISFFSHINKDLKGGPSSGSVKPDDKILALPKLNAFADDKLNTT